MALVNKIHVNRIRTLEKIAKEVLELKKERRRPILIEFCGSRKSGVSTVIKSLVIFLKRNGFNTKVLIDRADISPIVNKTSFLSNIWSMASVISELIENLENKHTGTDIIIFDRGFFDSLFWLEWLNKNPTPASSYLDDKSMKRISDFIQLGLWFSSLDLVYAFKMRPESSIKREYTSMLTKKSGTIMNTHVLGGLNIAIDTTLDKQRRIFRSTQKIIIEEKLLLNSQDIVNYSITVSVLKELRYLLTEKIGYFRNILKKKFVIGINSVDIIAQEKIRFDNRTRIEAETVIQPIAIAVITNPQRNRVLTVKKNKKKLSSRSPEREKLLLYIGGHIQKEDDNGDTLKTIKTALYREIFEEIGEYIFLQNQDPFIIYMPNSNAMTRHFAICFVIEIDFNKSRIQLISDEFTKKNGLHKEETILEVDKVISGNYDIDLWSTQIIEYVFGKTISKKNILFD